ncbi:glucosidase 2 subunit beta [Papilio machaon]|uniref:glucosidase 2 subunit beta n=1 Tax=Papilio machaon TaxID=76193 RepID=UPI001E6632FE|nr:glucosidase 2 subunit beta [Papilio machaon]
MIMGYKKKKNVIIVSLCVVFSFILYQLYFFLTITSETGNGNRIIPVLDHQKIKDVVHIRSEDDKYINENGLIRGVYYLHVQLYRPNHKNEFECRISKTRIPFEQVNDDYCDCEDGTDEPSTNACPNGTFYCQYQYKKKPVTLHTVPSSKINDGICDCCDGSDEWLNEPNKKLLSQAFMKNYRFYVSECPNTCH